MTNANTIFDAISAGDLAQVKTLIAATPALAGARNDKGMSAVTLACYRHQKEILEVLLIAEPTLDIFEAATAGVMPRVEELLSADPTQARAWSADGATALHLACFFRHADIVDLLIRAGSDIDVAAPGFGNVTPLHSAAAGRNPKIVARLLEAGANPNVVQHGGWTPLHATAMHGDTSSTRALLAHGADVETKADNGQTALDIAREKGHAEIVALLEAPVTR